MSLDENKAKARRLLAAMGAGDVAAALDLVAADVVAHDPGVDFLGREHLEQGLVHLHHAFPDLALAVDDLVAEGDRVAVRYHGTGTHLGEFRGFAATGRTFTYTGIIILRFRGGIIAEHWASPDLLGLFRQLGAAVP